MHPEFASILAAQRREEIRTQVARYRRDRPARRPGLHLSWSRLTSRNGSSLVIVISAHRA